MQDTTTYDFLLKKFEDAWPQMLWAGIWRADPPYSALWQVEGEKRRKVDSIEWDSRPDPPRGVRTIVSSKRFGRFWVLPEWVTYK